MQPTPMPFLLFLWHETSYRRTLARALHCMLRCIVVSASPEHHCENSGNPISASEMARTGDQSENETLFSAHRRRDNETWLVNGFFFRCFCPSFVKRRHRIRQKNCLSISYIQSKFRGRNRLLGRISDDQLSRDRRRPHEETENGSCLQEVTD